MRRFALSVSLSILLPLSTVVAQVPSPGALTARIDSAARDWIARKLVPSVSIAVSQGGKTVYSKAFGMANLELGVPARPETVYEIGSVTKQFTAAAILGLVEDGKLGLDDPLSRFFPDWPAAGRTATVKQLLNHTSGIKSYTSIPRWRSLMALPLVHDSMVALFRDEPADFEPGADWRYDNSGYYLLGLIIEKVTGQAYSTYIMQHLFEPAGLSSTSYCGTTAIVPGRAGGYSATSAGIVNAAPIYVDQAFAAGAICSTTGDLLTWTRALQSGKIVKPASYQAMTTPIPLPNGKRQTYGFGLGVSDLQGHRSVGHSGGINGFNSVLVSYPNDGLIVAILVNQDGGADKIGRAVSHWALGITDTTKAQ
jgi:CubicO group peptidase (beta-lactamase class C family)